MNNNPQIIDTRDFVYAHITPYDGDESFLVGPTEKTIKLWNIVKGLMSAEFKKGGVLDIDTNTVSRIIKLDILIEILRLLLDYRLTLHSNVQSSHCDELVLLRKHVSKNDIL